MAVSVVAHVFAALFGTVWLADPQLPPNTNPGWNPALPVSVEEAIGDLSWTGPSGAPGWRSPVQPGDTVLLLPGEFRCRGRGVRVRNPTGGWVFQQTDQCHIGISGLPGRAIHIVSLEPWAFSFDGGIVFPASIRHITLVDVRVHNAAAGLLHQGKPRVRTTTNPLPAGITVHGDDIALLRNLVENVGHPGIGAWAGAANKRIVGNIVRFVGATELTGDPDDPEWERGSATYLQNCGTSSCSMDGTLDGPAEVLDNMFFSNRICAVKAYGSGSLPPKGSSAAGPVDDFEIAGNITHLNPFAGIFLHRKHRDMHRIRLVGNVVFEPAGPALRLGHALYSNPGQRRVDVSGNMFASGHTAWLQSSEFKGNRIDANLLTVFPRNPAGTVLYPSRVAIQPRIFDFERDPAAAAAHHFDNNVFRLNAPNHRDAIVVAGQPQRLAPNTSGWMLPTTFYQSLATCGTACVTMAPAPTAPELHAHRMTSHPDTVLVAVFNWSGAPSAQLDLRPFFPTGAVIEIHDMQEFPNAYTTVAWFGGLPGATTTVSLDLHREQAVDFQLAPSLGDTWRGFDPRFRVFMLRQTDQLLPCQPEDGDPATADPCEPIARPQP